MRRNTWGANPVLGAVPDGPDVQVGVEGAEGTLDLGEGLVAGGDDLGGFQVAGLDAGAEHVDAVERGFGGDGVLVAGVAEVVLADVGPEVLDDLAPVQDPVRPQRDLVRAAQQQAGPGAGRGDLLQVSLVAVSSDSRLRARSAAGNGFMQATSRSPGKSGEVISARSRTSNRVSCRSPSRASFLTWGARSAVIQSRPAGATSSRSRAAVSMPRSPTRTTRVIPNRSLTLPTWLATVVGSPVLPLNTSMATGMPSLLVSRP